MPFSIQRMRNRFLVMLRSGRATLDGRFEIAITFDPTVASRSNFYWSFLDALFHTTDEESILGDVEVWSSHAGWTVRKGHNFRSVRWIVIKLLQEFAVPFSMQWKRNRFSVMMRCGRSRLE